MIKKLFKILVLMFIVLSVSVLGFVSFQILKAPSLNKVDATPDGYLTVILDRDGNEIQTLHDSESNRVYVDLSLIPEDLQHAIVAIEDARFYQHHGVDLKGIARAGWVAVTNGFKFTQGASTITQQLVKNNILTSWTSEDNMYDKVCRKVQELYLSMALEKRQDKEWILQNYLNTINLGGGTRGVETASQYYFGMHPGELSLAQCALIAGITKNPNGYNPFKNPKQSLKRQHLVLQAMLDQGYITRKEYKKARKEDVLAKLDQDHLNYASEQIFSYFEDVLLENVVEDLCNEYDLEAADAWNMLYSGGLTIYSTQDSELQEICEEKVKDTSLYSSDEEVSVVMDDVSTGAVLALVGGRKEKKASLIYNRATEAERQPGSTIKILGEYAAVLDKDLASLGSVYDDIPMTYSNGTAFKNAYSPYKGRLTLRDGIACSSNTLAVQAYRQAGYDRVKEYLDAFGLKSLEDEGDNEALAIGGSSHGVTNLEMTAAYNAIAAGGEYIAPYYYTKVTDHEGNELLQQHPDSRTVISQDTAALLTSAMTSVMAEGTGMRADFQGMDLAGKSGTTNGNRDLWFMGYSPYYTCGVWGGFDDNREQDSSSYVKDLWRNIMQQAVSVKGYQYYDKTFYMPDELECAEICIKCGNLAIPGLCNATLQGNMTRAEYFKMGSVPEVTCNCHKAMAICSESGMPVSSFCPEECRQEAVYLISASEQTEDEAYALNQVGKASCQIHSPEWWKHIQEKVDHAQDSLQEKTDQAQDYLHDKADQAEEYLDGWSNQIKDQWNEWFGFF